MRTPDAIATVSPCDANALEELAGHRPSQDTHVATLVGPAVLAVATLVAAVAFRTGLSDLRPVLPSLYAVATTAAVIAAYLLFGFARSTHDDTLRWVAASTALGALTLAAELAGDPAHAGGGGLLGTSPTGIALLALVGHLVPPLFALAGITRATGRSGRTGRHVASALATVAIAALAWGGTPLPTLVRADGSHGPALRAALATAAVANLIAVLRWVRRAGRRPTLAQSWVTVTLFLGFWDALFHAVSGRRGADLWWASLGLRTAQSVLLCAALAVGLVSLLQRLDRWADSLGDAGSRLARLAQTDPLTGLLNRRGLDDLAVVSMTSSCGVLYLDLDGFKAVNDTLGHERGDQLLVDVARSLRSVLRSSDLAARLGGDEFCVLLPGADESTCHTIARRVHRAVSAVNPVSVGVAWSPAPLPLQRLLTAGDHAMIEHKRSVHSRRTATAPTAAAPA